MQIEEEFSLSARRRIGARGSHGGAFMMRAARGGVADACAVTGGLVGEMFARSNDGETFVVEQALDLENCFDVLAAIETMAAWTFYRLERRKFRFPVAQDESFCRG